jgi:hypothetical protein
MLDLIYILGIVGFFGLMLAFVGGLERLGRDAVAEERDRT